MLPGELLKVNPLLNILYAWTLAINNPFENVHEIAKIAAHVQHTLEDSDMEDVNERTVAGLTTGIRGFLSQPPIQLDHDPLAVLDLLQESLEKNMELNILSHLYLL